MFKTINNQSIGLLFKNGNFVRMLNPGNHFIWPGQTLEIYARGTYALNHLQLSELLADEQTKEQLQVIEVKDNELGMQLRNGNFQHVIVPGRYGHWKDNEDREFIITDISNYEIDESIDRTILSRPNFENYIRRFNVDAWEKGLLFVNNRFDKVLDPGNYIFWKNTTPLDVVKVDTRQLQLEVSDQEILAADKAVLKVTFFCQYKINDILKAVIDIKDYQEQLIIMMQLEFRKYLGGLSLDQILEKKQEVGSFVTDKLRESCAGLGLTLINSGYHITG